MIFVKTGTKNMSLLYSYFFVVVEFRVRSGLEKNMGLNCVYLLRNNTNLASAAGNVTL
jgi:hypothetical protein